MATLSQGSAGRSAEPLEDHRHALAAADAHGLQTERLVTGAQTVEQGARDARSGHAERVTDGDRAAVDVELVDVDAELTVRRDHLGGERLVDLREVDVVDREPGALERLPGGLDRAESHDLRGQ